MNLDEERTTYAKCLQAHYDEQTEKFAGLLGKAPMPLHEASTAR